MAPMVPGREGVEHGPGGKGGEFPDGLHPRDRLSSLSGCHRLGPTEQLGPLMGTSMTLWLPPEVTHQLPC